MCANRACSLDGGLAKFIVTLYCLEVEATSMVDITRFPVIVKHASCDPPDLHLPDSVHLHPVTDAVASVPPLDTPLQNPAPNPRYVSSRNKCAASQDPDHQDKIRSVH